MRKTAYLLLGILTIAVSCTKEAIIPTTDVSTTDVSTTEAQSQKDGEINFSISAEQTKSWTEQTKSTYVDGASEVVWDKGDRMSVLDGTANRKFITYDNSANALFVGKISSTASSLTAIYPYCSGATLNGDGSVTTEFPASQWAVNGTIANDALVSIGKTSVGSGKISMKNVGGYIMFSIGSGLSGNGLSGIKSVDFTANGGEAITGTIKIEYDGVGNPTTTAITAGSTISLISPNGELSSGYYYMVANPVILASGFSVTLHRNDGKKATVSSTKSNTIVRNETLNLGDLSLKSLDWVNDPNAESFKEVVIDFAQWPFNEAKGNSTYYNNSSCFTTTAEGYRLQSEGPIYFQSAGLLSLGRAGSQGAKISLPEFTGYRLYSVRQESASESEPMFFSDEEGNTVSIKGTKIAGTDFTFYLNTDYSTGRIWAESATISTASTLTLTYATASTPEPEVSSITAFGSGSASFTFTGGNASDYSCGLAYIGISGDSGDSGDNWDSATLVPGNITASTSTSATFTASVPGGECRIRPYAKYTSAGNETMHFGPEFYSDAAKITHTLDFSGSTCPLTKYGSSKTGEGTADSPREGLDFPAGTQAITDGSQKTEGTYPTARYDGTYNWATYKTTTQWWSSYPYTKFYFGDKTVVFGAVATNRNAVCYHENGAITSNKCRFTFFNESGYRLYKLTFADSVTDGNGYVYQAGINGSYTNMGDTQGSIEDTPMDLYIQMSNTIPSSAVIRVMSNNRFSTGKIILEFVKE